MIDAFGDPLAMIELSGCRLGGLPKNRTDVGICGTDTVVLPRCDEAHPLNARDETAEFRSYRTWDKSWRWKSPDLNRWYHEHSRDSRCAKGPLICEAETKLREIGRNGESEFSLHHRLAR